MATNDEPSVKLESSTAKYARSRSITDHLSMGPIVAATRLISCISKHSRAMTSKRDYSTSTDDTDHPSNRKPLTRNRSTSPHPNPPLVNSSSTMRSSTTSPSALNHVSKTLRTSLTPSTPTPDTVGLDFNFDSTYAELRELAETNCKYFSEQKTDVCKRFEHLLVQLLQSIDLTVPLIRYLTDNFHHFDYSTEVRH